MMTAHGTRAVWGESVADAPLRIPAAGGEGDGGHPPWPRPQPDRRRQEATLMSERRYRAGDSVEDICRACKLDRMHTVIVADAEGRPIRVSCGYCDSEHNYRGGPASAASRPTFARPASPASYGGQAPARPPEPGLG